MNILVYFLTFVFLHLVVLFAHGVISPEMPQAIDGGGLITDDNCPWVIY